MRPAHFHALRRNAPEPLFEIDFVPPHVPDVTGARHSENEELKCRLQNWPTIVCIQRKQEPAELALVRYRRTMLYFHFEKRAAECVGRII